MPGIWPAHGSRNSAYYVRTRPLSQKLIELSAGSSMSSENEPRERARSPQMRPMGERGGTRVPQVLRNFTPAVETLIIVAAAIRLARFLFRHANSIRVQCWHRAPHGGRSNGASARPRRQRPARPLMPPGRTLMMVVKTLRRCNEHALFAQGLVASGANDTYHYVCRRA